MNRTSALKADALTERTAGALYSGREPDETFIIHPNIQKLRP